MAEMDISVIIPVYNAEKFLTRAALSAVMQEWVSEVILVEDGSKDNSLELCKKLEREHNKIRLYCHEGNKNRGAGASRNLGIEMARSQLIAFLDADDFYLENRFAHDLQLLQQNPRADGVYNAIGTSFYDEEGKRQFINRGHNEDFVTTITRQIDPETLFENMGPIGNCGWFHCDGVTLRRQAFQKAGYFDEELELTQDTHLWLRMALTCKLIPGKIDEPVAMRGVHSANRISNVARMNLFLPLMYRKLLDWACKNNVSRARKALIWSRLCKCHPRGSRFKNFLGEIIRYPEAIKYPGFFPLFWKLLLDDLQRLGAKH